MMARPTKLPKNDNMEPCERLSRIMERIGEALSEQAEAVERFQLGLADLKAECRRIKSDLVAYGGALENVRTNVGRLGDTQRNLARPVA